MNLALYALALFVCLKLLLQALHNYGHIPVTQLQHLVSKGIDVRLISPSHPGAANF